MTWQPFAPDAQGFGWMATREPGVQLEGYTAGAVVSINGVGVTEDIAAVRVFVDRTGVTPEDGYELSIYDYDDLAEGDLETSVYRPTADYAFTAAGAWDESVGSTYIDLWEAIDSAALTPGTYAGRTVPNDSFIFPLYGEGAEYLANFGALVGDLVGRGIAGIRLRAQATEIVDVVARQPVAGATITPFLDIDGLQYLGPPQMVPSTGAAAEVRGSWQANPATGRSWTPADLDNFGDGTWGAGWMIASTGSVSYLPVILQGWLEVDSVPVDKRLAVGVLRSAGSQVNSWERIELLDPATGAVTPWAKELGTRVLMVLRRRWGSGWMLWRRILGDPTYPNGWGHGEPIILPSGRLAASTDGNVATLGDVELPGSFSFIFERDDGASSLDSQPYASIGDDVSGRSGFFDYWTRVDSSQTLTQEFTPAVGVDVGYLRVEACVITPDVEDLLTVELVDLSGPTVLQTVTFDPVLLGDQPTRFQVLEDYLPAVESLTGAQQYALRFTCPAPRAEGWRVNVASTGRIGGPTNPPADVGDVTFALGVNELRVGATSYAELTAAAQVHSLAETPADLTATPTGIVDGIDTVAVTWGATSVTEGGGFDSYELERLDDRTDWQQIEVVRDELVTEFEDVEARCDVASTYRVRVRRVDGSVSPWSNEDTATPEGPACGYVLGSNTDPDRTVWVDTIGEVWTLEMPEQVSTQQPVGRNGSLVQRELEDRLDRFAVTAFIAGLGALQGTPQTPAEAGQRAFDDLRILIGNRRDPATGRKFLAPYIAVKAPGGDRWLASITTNGGARSEPDGSYSMSLTVQETTDVAATPDLTPEPVS